MSSDAKRQTAAAVRVLAEYRRNIRAAGGAITWDVPAELNGRISESFQAQLRAVGRALNSTNKTSP